MPAFCRKLPGREAKAVGQAGRQAPRIAATTVLQASSRPAAWWVNRSPVQARRLHQVGVAALLGHPAAVEHQDAVQRAHGRQPVRDDDAGAALHQPLHRVLDQRLGVAVQARCRLIQDQDRRVGQERPRQRHALALAAGQLHPALPDQRRIAARKPDDEVVRVGQPGRPLDLGLRRGRIGIGDVLRQRTVEQHRFLRHDGDLPAQAGLRDQGDVLAVDRDAPVGDVVQPLDQLDEGGLAGTGVADQPDPLAGADGQRQAVIQRRGVAGVAEGDGLEVDAGRRRRPVRAQTGGRRCQAVHRAARPSPPCR